MPNRALPVPRLELLRLADPQHLARELEVVLCDCELVLREQERPACAAAEEVCFDGFAERDGGVGGPFAEDDDVGEVWSGGGGGCGGWFGNERVEGVVFTENAARRENGEDGADDVGGGGEGEVAGIVLNGV